MQPSKYAWSPLAYDFSNLPYISRTGGQPSQLLRYQDNQSLITPKALGVASKRAVQSAVLAESDEGYVSKRHGRAVYPKNRATANPQLLQRIVEQERRKTTAGMFFFFFFGCPESGQVILR
jgi:hypothetical protein